MTQTRMRMARWRDCLILRRWRNENRQWMGNPEPVGLLEHLRWYRRVMRGDGVIVVVATLRWRRIGMATSKRLSEDLHDVGVIVPVRYRKCGVGKALVDCIEALLYRYAGRGRMRAVIKPDNAASIALFMRSGFVAVDTSVPGMVELRKQTEPVGAWE